MADIEIVIKIPEGIMEYIKNNGCLSVIYTDEVAKAIINGTPLPKGHGRLIDADAYLKEVCNYKETGCGSCRFQIVCPVDALTIIEADKEADNE